MLLLDNTIQYLVFVEEPHIHRTLSENNKNTPFTKGVALYSNEDPLKVKKPNRDRNWNVEQ